MNTSISITKISGASDADWDLAWQTCDQSTYSQSRAWAKLWIDQSQGFLKSSTLKAEFTDGQTAILPLATGSQYKGLAKFHVTPAGGGYGGWLSCNPLSDSHKELLLSTILKMGSISWLSNPFDKFSIENTTHLGSVDDTYLLNLDAGIEKIFKSWTKGHKSATQQARKSGIHICEALSEDDWRSYFRVYQDSLRRWGHKATSNYPWSVFERLFSFKDKSIKLWIAKHDDDVVAGALCLYSKHHVSYWHGAVLESSMPFRPVNLLMYSILQNACMSGFRWFDFGLSGGHEGVSSFKRSFGAQPTPCRNINIHTRWSTVLKTLANARERVLP